MIRRLLTRLLYALLSGFVIASALLYALVGTEPGTRWVIATAVHFIGPELHIERSRGSLLGGLDLYGVSWHDASTELNVARIRLRWRPLDLLAGRLHLDEVGASHIFLALPAATKQATNSEQSALPHISLPLGIVLRRLDVRDLIVMRDDRAWRIGRIQARARLRGARLHVSALRIATPQGSLQLVGSATLNPPYSNDLRLAWTWRTPDGAELAGHGSLGGDMDRIVLSQRLNAPFSARLRGHVDPRTLAADLTLEWSAAHWPLQGQARLKSPTGKLVFKGTPDAYQTTLKSRIEGPGLPATGIALQAAGDRRHLRFDALQLTTLGGRIDGQGRLAWEPELRWQARLHGEGIDPAGIRPDWPGHLAFDLSAEGGAETFAARLTRLAGTLRGIPVSATAAARWQQQTLYLSSAELQAGANKIRLSGRADAKRGDLAVRLDLPQIQSLLPAVHGRLSGQGKLDGPWSWPRITANVRGDDLSWNGLRIHRARLNVAPADNDALNARIALEDVQRGRHTLRRVQAQVTGTPKQQRLALNVDAPEGRLALAAEGGFDAGFDRWQGRLNRLSLTPAQGEAWRLDAPSTLDIGAREQKLAETCLRPTDGRNTGLCVRFDAGGGRLDAAARLQALPLTLINPWLPPDMRLAGQAEGTAELKGPVSALNGQVMARIDGGELHLGGSNGPHTIAFAVPVLQATLSAGAVNARLLAELPKQKARIEAQADIGSAQTNGERPLSGSLRLDLPELSALQAFVPQLHDLNGRAQAQLALGGTLAQPRLSGTAALDDGSATLVAAGTRLEHVRLHARMPANSDGLSFEASADSGPGSLQAKGQILGLDSTQPRLTAQLRGTNFQALNLPRIQARISPRLDIEADRSRIKIRGKVEVPEAKIRVRRLPAKAVSVSPDVEIVGRAKPQSTGPKIDAEIELLLGDKVSIDALGLSGNLSGNLLLHQQDGAATTADGSLNISDGTYSSYGLNLAISRGVLNFAGPVDNPGLDVVAERKTGAVTAKLSVTGTLQSPRSEVSADPPMSQADALSWLLTGHGINEGSRSDAALLLRAVYSMNVNDNGGGLVSQLEQRTGLNEISVQGGDTLQQSALVLGKYLTPDIYVRYTTGLFERMNTLALTYRLTRHLSVEAQSGAAQALDLLYQIDFGGG